MLQKKKKKKTFENQERFYDDRYIKIKMKAYGDKVYTKCHGSNVPKDDTACESFTAISIDSLLVNENNIICMYLQTIALIKL